MNKKFEETLKIIRSQFGDESVMTLRENVTLKVDKVSSGSLKIDSILGGGLPMGRMVEIYGPEASGKTTITLHVVAECMKKYPDKLAAFIDAEHALDPEYAEKLGVDLDRLIINQPNSGEEGLEIAEALIRSGDVSVVIIDSVDALTPEVTIKGDMGDTHVAPLARLMSRGVRKLSGAVKKNNALLVFVNQIREKVGIMFGNPETTSGGRALKFYTTQRLEVRKTGKPEEKFVQAKVKCVKNKVARPYLETTIDIAYGKGILLDGEIVDMAVEYEVLTKAGAWYKMDGKSFAQGRTQLIDILEDSPELKQELFDKVKKAIINKKS